MIKLLKILYWLLTRFSWGWGLVAQPMALVRDLGTVLLVLALLFKITFGVKWDIGIGLVCFFLFVGFGELLYRQGVLDYATKLGNSTNPELKKINLIAQHLGIKE